MIASINGACGVRYSRGVLVVAPASSGSLKPPAPSHAWLHCAQARVGCVRGGSPIESGVECGCGKCQRFGPTGSSPINGLEVKSVKRRRQAWSRKWHDISHKVISLNVARHGSCWFCSALCKAAVLPLRPRTRLTRAPLTSASRPSIGHKRQPSRSRQSSKRLPSRRARTQ
jgi:hypothetical protein